MFSKITMQSTLTTKTEQAKSTYSSHNFHAHSKMNVLEWFMWSSLFFFTVFEYFHSMHESRIHNWLRMWIVEVETKNTITEHRNQKWMYIFIYKERTKNLYVSNSYDRSTLSAKWKRVSTMFIGAVQSFISPDRWNKCCCLTCLQDLFMVLAIFTRLFCSVL